MRLSFDNNVEIQHEVEQHLLEFPLFSHFNLNSIAPYPDINSHNGFEIFFVHSGLGHFIVGDHIFALNEGSLVFLRPFTLHKIIQNDPNANICRHVLVWSESFLAIPEPIETQISEHECFFIQTNPQEKQQIENLLASLHEEFIYKPEGHLPMLHSFITQLLWTCHRIRASSADDSLALQQSKHIPDEINYVVQYISANFMYELTLEQLSKLVHVNKFYLTAVFKKHIGITMGEFITKKRIHYAKKLLRETTEPLNEICFQAGFNNLSYFGHVFKTQESMTPSDYRKKMR